MPMADDNVSVLDLGCGEGYFTQLLYNALTDNGFVPEKILNACDLQPQYYKFDKIACAGIALGGLWHKLQYKKKEPAAYCADVK